MSILNQYKREIEELQMFLSEIGNQLEHVSGFVQRKSELSRQWVSENSRVRLVGTMGK